MIYYFDAYKKELRMAYAQKNDDEIINKEPEFWIDHIARGNQCDADLMVLLRERDIAMAKVKEVDSELSAEREAHQWIPVSEGLPEDPDEIVRAVSKSGDEYHLCFNVYWYFPDDENGDEICVDIIFWQHIPKPPERKE